MQGEQAGWFLSIFHEPRHGVKISIRDSQIIQCFSDQLGDLVTKIMTQEVWGLDTTSDLGCVLKVFLTSSHAGLVLMVLRPYLEQQALPHHVAASSYYMSRGWQEGAGVL